MLNYFIKAAGRIRHLLADYVLGLPEGEVFELERLPFGQRGRPAARQDEMFFAPRRDVAPMRITLPVDWDADPHHDRNWRAQLHMWRAMDAHLVGYAETRDLAWLNLPVALMLDWRRWHWGGLKGPRASRYSWADIINGIRASKIAYVLSVDRERGFLDRWQRYQLLDLARAHVLHIMFIQPLRYSNHMFDDLIGLAALRTQLGPRVAARITAFIDRELPKLLRIQYTSEGVHCENSPGYQRFANSKLREMMRTGWFDEAELQTLLAKGEAVESWFRMPDRSFAPVGDTDGRVAGPPRRSGDGPFGLFNRDGYVVHRQSPRPGKPPSSYFFHMAAYHSRNHKHNDDLSYIWYDRQDIICDVGKYAYKDDVWAIYAKSVQAHNTIQIDDLSFRTRALRESFEEQAIQDSAVRKGGLLDLDFAFSTARQFAAVGIDNLRAFVFGRERGIYGSAVCHVRKFDPDLVVSSAVHHAHMGIDHVRTLVFRPGHYILCIDHVADHDPDGEQAARSPRRLTQWTHFAPSIRLAQAGALHHCATLNDGRPLTVSHVSTNTDFATRLVRGQETPEIQGWISEAYRKMTPADVIGASQPHKGVSLLASLVLIGKRPCPLEIRTGTADGIDKVVIAPAGRELVITPDDGTRAPRLRVGPLRKLD